MEEEDQVGLVYLWFTIGFASLKLPVGNLHKLAVCRKWMAAIARPANLQRATPEF